MFNIQNKVGSWTLAIIFIILFILGVLSYSLYSVSLLFAKTLSINSPTLRTIKYLNVYNAHHIRCCIYVFYCLKASPQAFQKHFKASRESAVQIIDLLALCFGLGGRKFHSCASFASCSVASVLQFVQLQSVIYAFCVAIVSWSYCWHKIKGGINYNAHIRLNIRNEAHYGASFGCGDYVLPFLRLYMFVEMGQKF